MNGIDLLTPSSAVAAGSGSSATINTNGSVSFSACISLSLNDVFTTTYENYMLVASFSAATSDEAVRFRLRAAGADNTATANYNACSLTLAGTSETVANITTGGYLFAGGVAVTGLGTMAGGTVVYVYKPNATTPTAVRSISMDRRSTITIFESAGNFELTNQFDGFTIYPASGNFTGLICVYGLVN